MIGLVCFIFSFLNCISIIIMLHMLWKPLTKLFMYNNVENMM